MSLSLRVMNTLQALAETHVAIAPQARLVWHAAVTVSDRQPMGRSPTGDRYIVPITGGRFWGGPGHEALCGEVVSGGADRQLWRPDGMKELDALYELRCDDGTMLTVHNRVLIDESVQPRYAQSHVSVTAPEGPHAWLNRRRLVGTLQPLRPQAEAVLIRVWCLQ